MATPNEYKLFNIDTILGQGQYKNFMLGIDQQCYLCPDLYRQSLKRVMQPNYDPEKSNLFSLGLCALEMATLATVQDSYDEQNQCIRELTIVEKLNSLINRYSGKTVNLL